MTTLVLFGPGVTVGFNVWQWKVSQAARRAA